MSKGPVTRGRLTLSLPLEMIDAIDDVLDRRLAASKSDAAALIMRKGWAAVRRVPEGNVRRQWVRGNHGSV